MNYIYHIVPKNLEGVILYSLNTLKEIKPDLYDQHIKKYIGREHVMREFIPTLQCPWNDVLHFSPVHPQEIKDALIEIGFTIPEMKFFQIDPFTLNPENTTIYLNAQGSKEDNMLPENFASFNPEDIYKYSKLPQATKEYYNRKFQKNEQPLMFVMVPHVLYKGNIDISNCEIITI